MVQSIEVFLQPPSPIINTVDKLPPIKTIFSEDKEEQLLPTIKVNNEEEKIPIIKVNDDKLKVMEPHFDSPATSPYQGSPLMTFSSPSASPSMSSILGSPMISPINEGGSFLLPPPDTSCSNNSLFRRGRSLSNASNKSPLSSPSIRYLSEPPSFNLQQEEETTLEDDYSPIFGPKRKRGRPPNSCQTTKSQNDHFTFVKPTVWDVKNNNLLTTPVNTTNHHTLTNNKKMSDGINTFTTTNMDLALSIPKKKRGRKPKKQLIGNSCFVWKDLTAPRGANKKSKK